MKQNTKKVFVRNLTFSALSLALCLVLPFLTGQIREVGKMLCPMHLPVLLAGFLCGPWWALAVGFIAPLLRHLLFAMPQMPGALGMAFEMAAYGLISGLLYQLTKKTVPGIYLSLLGAMVGGRVIWGCAMVIILGVSGGSFPWQAFLAGAVLDAVPGIILQIVAIPLIVMALRKAKLME